ncbi:MAG: hypothetical protein COA94_00365 [Rickettsiales bacterium]|nr:MAG: hypothetical protein COA94_00365 [Rickettsiales bacterium]
MTNNKKTLNKILSSCCIAALISVNGTNVAYGGGKNTFRSEFLDQIRGGFQLKEASQQKGDREPSEAFDGLGKAISNSFKMIGDDVDNSDADDSDWSDSDDSDSDNHDRRPAKNLLGKAIGEYVESKASPQQEATTTQTRISDVEQELKAIDNITFVRGNQIFHNNGRQVDGKTFGDHAGFIEAYKESTKKLLREKLAILNAQKNVTLPKNTHSAQTTEVEIKTPAVPPVDDHKAESINDLLRFAMMNRQVIQTGGKPPVVPSVNDSKMEFTNNLMPQQPITMEHLEAKTVEEAKKVTFAPALEILHAEALCAEQADDLMLQRPITMEYLEADTVEEVKKVTFAPALEGPTQVTFEARRAMLNSIHNLRKDQEPEESTVSIKQDISDLQAEIARLAEEIKIAKAAGEERAAKLRSIVVSSPEHRNNMIQLHKEIKNAYDAKKRAEKEGVGEIPEDFAQMWDDIDPSTDTDEEILDNFEGMWSRLEASALEESPTEKLKRVVAKMSKSTNSKMYAQMQAAKLATEAVARFTAKKRAAEKASRVAAARLAAAKLAAEKFVQNARSAALGKGNTSDPRLGLVVVAREKFDQATSNLTLTKKSKANLKEKMKTALHATDDLGQMANTLDNATNHVEKAVFSAQAAKAHAAAGNVNMTLTAESANTNAASRLAYAYAAGDDDTGFTHGLWVKGFVSKGSLKDQYKMTNNGFTIGSDIEINDDTILGIAFTLPKTKVNYDKKFAMNSKISSHVGTIYGSHNFANHVFVNGKFSYGKGTVKTDRKVNGGIAKSKFKPTIMNIELDSGRSFMLGDGYSITPKIGCGYSAYSAPAYKETGASNDKISAAKRTAFNLKAGISLAKSIAFESGIMLKPEIHAYVEHEVGVKNKNQTIKHDGIWDIESKLHNAKNKAVKINLGSSLKVSANERVDCDFGYDFNKKAKFSSHTGYLRLRLNF